VDGVNPSGVEQDPLGKRGLTRIDVGADSDVPDRREVVNHLSLSCLLELEKISGAVKRMGVGVNARPLPESY
jgi:hypothetical protein